MALQRTIRFSYLQGHRVVVNLQHILYYFEVYIIVFNVFP